MPRRNTFAGGRTGRANARSINAIITDYRRFKDVVDSESFRIMETAAQMTLDATMPYVPIETGALRESGRAMAVRTSKGVAAIVSFGGEDYPVAPTKNAPNGYVDYAPIVNYDVTLNHPVGEALFLEKGAMESKQAVDAYIIGEYRKLSP